MPKPYMTPSMVRTCLAAMGVMVAVASTNASASHLQGQFKQSSKMAASNSTENGVQTPSEIKSRKNTGKHGKFKTRRAK